MISGKKGFVTGFVMATVLCGTVVFSAVGLYTPNPEGNWIRDTTKYAPGTDDQINVLGDLAPGGAVVMQEVGVRLNALNYAGKKQNWDFATYESEELEEALDRLAMTRPGMATDLESFITTSLASLNDAITAQDKTAFKTAIGNVATACTSCHDLYGMSFLVVKPGKSILPIQ